MAQKKNQTLDQFESSNEVVVDDILYQDNSKFMDTVDATAFKEKFYINNDAFKNCKISLLAVMKMLNHACMGDNKEVMGFLLGSFTNDTYVVLDIEPIPAEASEVSVSIQNEQWQFWYDTLALREKENKKEKLIGWYHSHPGYRPFFSGTDVTTTQLMKNNMKQIGFGIVIDHITTIVSGKLDIGAFNTWHNKFNGNIGSGEYHSNKDYKFKLRKGNSVKEFGTSHDKYYDLNTTVFKNSADQALIEVLWNKFWKNTLSRSPIFTEQNQYVKQDKQAIQTIKSANEDKNITKDQLISGEHKEPYTEGVNSALDRNQGVVDEIVKNMLFN